MMKRREPVDRVVGPKERPVRASWERCIGEHRLDRGRRPEIPTLTRGEIREHQSSLSMDFAALREELARLKGMVGCAGYSVSLADAQGVIVHEEQIGDAAFHCRSDRLGSIWTESRNGTSGIGTCLVDQAPTAVFHDEHFFEAFTEQACIAVPVFGDDGLLCGIVNLSTHNPGLDAATHKLAMRIAVDCTDRLDERVFRDRHRGDYVIRLAGTSAGNMLLAVDGDDRVVGANRAARSGLALVDSALGSRSLWGVFERSRGLRSVHDLLEGRVELRALASGSSIAASVDGPTRSRPVPGGGMLTLAKSGKGEHALAARRPLDLCVGGDRAMARQVALIRRVVGAGLPILALGETGVGKDTLARAIHEESSRAAGPFVVFNCATVPDTLIDSELFGYGGGAFTGAKKEGSQGRLVEASGGTLFLDEIGDMPLAQQTRLLRVLESGEVTPLGGGKTRKVDLQIVAATHQDIRRRVEEGLFRQDLFYRLAGLVVPLPALRDRDDVVDLFHALVAACEGGARTSVSADAVRAVRAYAWPGNVREMKYVAQRAVRLCADGVVTAEDLLLEQLTPAAPAEATRPVVEASRPPSWRPDTDPSAKSVVACAERDAIAQALSETPESVGDCARRLGMSRATLYRKLKAHGLGPHAR